MENSVEYRRHDKDKYSHHSNTDPKTQEDDINASGSFSNSRHELETPVTISKEEVGWVRRIMKMANSCLLQVLSMDEILSTATGSFSVEKLACFIAPIARSNCDSIDRVSIAERC